MKLHLGCGKRRFDGYLNIDLHNSDMDMDIRRLPFDDETIDEIVTVHVCEHFYKYEIQGILQDWRRVLKPGGVFIAELPCLDKVLWHFANGSSENFTLWPLYGDPRTHIDGEPALHKWCWSKSEFNNLLADVGFICIKEETPKFHQPSRDMRWVCIKHY